MDMEKRIFVVSRGALCLSVLALLLVFFGMAGSSYAINLGSQLTQCANDTDNDGIIGACTWITGALQGTNATYAESDGVPQRWLFEHEVPVSGVEVHTAVFEYTFTKN